ncbi:unnamed protein product [Ixodes pacificus]
MDVYNERIDGQRIKARWDREGGYLLARKEVELGPSRKNINEVLHSHFPSRSFDAIKNHPKDMAYKELAQGARPKRELRASRRNRRSLPPESPGSHTSSSSGEESSRESSPTHPVREAVLPAREAPGESSEEEIREELRKLLSQAPPRAFQGSRLWDLAQRALLGIDMLRHLEYYLLDVFVVPAPPRKGQRSRPDTLHVSRRKRKRSTQQRRSGSRRGRQTALGPSWAVRARRPSRTAGAYCSSGGRS